MAPPFLDRLGHKGFSPPPSEPSQAPTHDQSCSPPGSPGSFSELRTLVSFPTGTDGYMLPVTPEALWTQDTWTLSLELKL